MFSSFDSFFSQPDLAKEAQQLIQLAIAEDCAHEDITSKATISENQWGRARVIAKQGGILAGLSLAAKIYSNFSPSIAIETFKNDGDEISNKELILRLAGPLSALLKGERILINFLQHLSGIATATRQLVDALEGSGIKLLDTRKTHPGYRSLAKYAVLCGGGHNHRPNLQQMFLIKENHIRAAGSLEAAIQQCQQYRQKNQLSSSIEVEVTNLEEFQLAHDFGVDMIMLDHFPQDWVIQAAKRNSKQIPLELSGNIHAENVQKIRQYPIQYVSSGAITHSAASLDLSMLVSNYSQ